MEAYLDELRNCFPDIGLLRVIVIPHLQWLPRLLQEALVVALMCVVLSLAIRAATALMLRWKI